MEVTAKRYVFIALFILAVGIVLMPLGIMSSYIYLDTFLVHSSFVFINTLECFMME